MPMLTPMPTKSPGEIFTSGLWNSYLRDNIDKLLTRGHRVLTVAQFSALTALEGTKGAVAPDEVYLEVDSTNGILWHLAYESGEVTYKWRFLGGPPMLSEVATAETTTSTTYAALATAGPSITLPRSGDYDIETGTGKSTGGQAAIMSYDIGATAAVDADAVYAGDPLGSGSTSGGNASRYKRKAALTPVTLTAKYKGGAAGTVGFQHRSLRVRPVRIRHDA